MNICHLFQEEHMRQHHRKMRHDMSFCLGLCSLMLLTLSACIHQPSQDSSAQVDYGTAPSLSGLSASPNPATGGSIIQLNTTYVDPDSDLHSGLAAVSIDDGDVSRIAFRATYPSGVLTLPLSISPYSRPSDLRISLKIRDDAGNWSNAVSMTLLVRDPSDGKVDASLLSKENGGL
jgi:hypothetical protein